MPFSVLTHTLSIVPKTGRQRDNAICGSGTVCGKPNCCKCDVGFSYTYIMGGRDQGKLAHALIGKLGGDQVYIKRWPRPPPPAHPHGARFMAGDIAHELSAQSAQKRPVCLSSCAIGLSARGASHGLQMERLQLRPGFGRGRAILRHGG